MCGNILENLELKIISPGSKNWTSRLSVEEHLPRKVFYRNILRAAAKEESFLGIATTVVKSGDCCQRGYRPKRARWCLEWPTSGYEREESKGG